MEERLEILSRTKKENSAVAGSALAESPGDSSPHATAPPRNGIPGGVARARGETPPLPSPRSSRRKMGSSESPVPPSPKTARKIRLKPPPEPRSRQDKVTTSNTQTNGNID